MNHVERFRAVMNLQPVDCLPMWEFRGFRAGGTPASFL
jgi:hypothetical protein